MIQRANIPWLHRFARHVSQSKAKMEIALCTSTALSLKTIEWGVVWYFTCSQKWEIKDGGRIHSVAAPKLCVGWDWEELEAQQRTAIIVIKCYPPEWFKVPHSTVTVHTQLLFFPNNFSCTVQLLKNTGTVIYS